MITCEVGFLCFLFSDKETRLQRSSRICLKSFLQGLDLIWLQYIASSGHTLPDPGAQSVFSALGPSPSTEVGERWAGHSQAGGCWSGALLPLERTIISRVKSCRAGAVSVKHSPPPVVWRQFNKHASGLFTVPSEAPLREARGWQKQVLGWGRFQGCDEESALSYSLETGW